MHYVLRLASRCTDNVTPVQQNQLVNKGIHYHTVCFISEMLRSISSDIDKSVLVSPIDVIWEADSESSICEHQSNQITGFDHTYCCQENIIGTGDDVKDLLQKITTHQAEFNKGVFLEHKVSSTCENVCRH